VGDVMDGRRRGFNGQKMWTSQGSTEVPIESFQSPRHALADSAATRAGASALPDSSWRVGGTLSARAAKAAAGRPFDNYSPGSALPAIVTWS
jgi:hypothetical protein